MSLTVTCTTCRIPDRPRQIVQWRESCRECAEDLIARHLKHFPDHRIELTGRVSDAPFSTPRQIQRLIGRAS